MGGKSDTGHPTVKKVVVLEDQMQQHARDLEFEAAAALRDEIAKIKFNFLEMPTKETTRDVKNEKIKPE